MENPYGTQLRATNPETPKDQPDKKALARSRQPEEEGRTQDAHATLLVAKARYVQKPFNAPLEALRPTMQLATGDQAQPLSIEPSRP